MTAIMSAFLTVLKRCATMIVVLLTIILSNASCTTLSDSASNALVASSRTFESSVAALISSILASGFPYAILSLMLAVKSTAAAFEYAVWPRDAILAITIDMTPPDMTSRGIEDNMTNASVTSPKRTVINGRERPLPTAAIVPTIINTISVESAKEKSL
nr:hypothetical protein Ccrd_012503 [Ipomoea batatas]